MSTPPTDAGTPARTAPELSPDNALKALDLARKANGIGQFRALMHLIAHPGPMSCEDLRNALRISQVMAWTHLTNLVNLGLVHIAGRNHVHSTTGNKTDLYQLAKGVQE